MIELGWNDTEKIVAMGEGEVNKKFKSWYSQRIVNRDHTVKGLSEFIYQ